MFGSGVRGPGPVDGNLVGGTNPGEVVRGLPPESDFDYVTLRRCEVPVKLPVKVLVRLGFWVGEEYFKCCLNSVEQQLFLWRVSLRDRFTLRSCACLRVQGHVSALWVRRQNSAQRHCTIVFLPENMSTGQRKAEVQPLETSVITCRCAANRAAKACTR
jgi:hypothetical protein